MAGHNKWSKVKHRKEAVDAKKAKIFSDLAKDITLISREVSGDTSSPRLRTLMDKARQVNMPNENIERAIAKGIGAGAADREKVIYEAYGPGGAAFLIETETDSTNRTIAELKQILSKLTIELAAPGSAMWAFIKTDGVYIPQAPLSVSEEEAQAIKKIQVTLSTHQDVVAVITNAVV